MKNYLKYFIFIFFMFTCSDVFSATNSDATLFETDEIVYDKNTGKFTTVGDVKIDYKSNKLLTKQMEYDVKTKEITADGRIDISNKDSVMDTQKLVINTETDKASLGEINVKFGKNSYAKAESANMTNPTKIILEDVEYTACKEGLNDCSNSPTWKIGAGSVTHNRETGSLFYTNALLYMWNFPVFYLPILQNYTPNIKNKTGLLIPKFGTSTKLGNVFQIPFFIKLNDYNDMTISPMFTTNRGTIWFGEYRTNQDYFTSVTSGSFKEKDSANNEDKRWFINTNNYFEINDIWRGTIHIERVSDYNYLRTYDFNTDPWLSSNIELEGSLNRSYLTADMYFYQALHSNYTYTPKVMPIINYKRVSEPNEYGGFWDFNLNTSHIILDYNNKSTKRDETNFRTSSILRYSQPFKTSGGHLFNFGIEGRGDLFVLDDVEDNQEASGYYSGSTGRANISADLMWKYPLYRSYSNRTEILEPTIQLIASPKQSSDSSIPNMDSSYLELETENLFSTDRFSGYDLFESGVRVNYGINFIQNYNNNQQLAFFIGQNYNIDVPDDLYIANSGLKNDKGASDIVSSISYTPSNFFRLQYKTRLSHNDFRANRNDVNLYIGPKALNLTLSYVYLRNMFIEDGDSVKSDELYAYVSSQLTRNWKVFVGNRYDLDQHRSIKFLSGLEYENDCFKFNINLVNDYTRDKDYVGDKSIYFTLAFKTLGSISSSFGVSSDSN